jgi:hypothetical protein
MAILARDYRGRISGGVTLMPMRANASDLSHGESGLVAYLRAKGRAWLGSTPADSFRGRWRAHNGALYDCAGDGLKIVEGGTMIEYRCDRAADFAMSYHWAEMGEMRAQFPSAMALGEIAAAGQSLPVLRVRRGARETIYVITVPKKRMMALSSERILHLFRAG